MKNIRINKIKETISWLEKEIKDSEIEIAFYNLDMEFEPWKIVKIENKIKDVKINLKRLNKLLEKEKSAVKE